MGESALFRKTVFKMILVVAICDEDDLFVTICDEIYVCVAIYDLFITKNKMHVFRYWYMLCVVERMLIYFMRI